MRYVPTDWKVLTWLSWPVALSFVSLSLAQEIANNQKKKNQSKNWCLLDTWSNVRQAVLQEHTNKMIQERPPIWWCSVFSSLLKLSEGFKASWSIVSRWL